MAMDIAGKVKEITDKFEIPYISIIKLYSNIINYLK